MGFGRWYKAQKGVVQAAVVTGGCGIVAAIVIGVFSSVTAELAKPGPQTSTPPPGPTLPTSGSPTHTPSPTPTRTGPSTTPVCATGSLQLIGSTAFMPIAQEAAYAYMQACPEATITVTGGDSAYGLTRVCDTGASASSMIAMYDGLSSACARLRPYPMGALIFSVVAHTGLFPAGNITTAELRKIFVKPGEQGYVAVGRRAGSGSREAFITNILGLDPATLVPDKGNCPHPTGSAFSFTSCTEDSTADLLSFVNSTPNAIGYAEVFPPLSGYSQVSVLNIDNAGPSRADVLNGSYRFWTVEHLYAAMQPTALASDFLDFLPYYIESNPPPNYIACSGALKRLGAAC